MNKCSGGPSGRWEDDNTNLTSTAPCFHPTIFRALKVNSNVFAEILLAVAHPWLQSKSKGERINEPRVAEGVDVGCHVAKWDDGKKSMQVSVQADGKRCGHRHGLSAQKDKSFF